MKKYTAEEKCTAVVYRRIPGEREKCSRGRRYIREDASVWTLGEILMRERALDVPRSEPRGWPRDQLYTRVCVNVCAPPCRHARIYIASTRVTHPCTCTERTIYVCIATTYARVCVCVRYGASEKKVKKKKASGAAPLRSAVTGVSVLTVWQRTQHHILALLLARPVRGGG